MSTAKSSPVEQHFNDYERIQAVIGRQQMVMPVTPENQSRDSLMRVKAGIHHLLTEVVPGIENQQDRQEVYAWLDGMYSILRIEEFSARSEART
ncbi:transcriptional regulator [Buttiauxella sp. 3AFRM03]|uniref:transcriptional regulator n=1 Tax=Buttiauxella sp. 3AFRM03 TaxID=2479367 RepID=UPI000EF79C85|nr:transcriptional regulator [Buttiauxella sp. 3AFRM03]AYN29009.1 transcriptional regulator [Buttiauxella sp. 3AFRM03]